MSFGATDRRFYRWRQMTPIEREAVLAGRRANDRPWHSPPHISNDSGLYLVTAACYEHRSVIGHSPERMLEFSNALVDTCQSADFTIYAWVVLPNHYHVLLKADEARTVIQTMGRMHGRTSFRWNQEENCHGRQNWFNAMETGIKSERHFWASLIYVMNNPVKHRYVDRWQDWPFSNAEEWLATMGRDDAKRIWKEFPIDDFGREWDPPDI